MPFYAPLSIPALPTHIPDDITVADFMFQASAERHSLEICRPPFTCGLTGKQYSALEVKDRVEALTRGLAKELDWRPTEGTEWDKVIGVYSVNTIDTLTLAWATHRLGGIQTPASATYSPSELEYQLRDSGARVLFTCLPLLQNALVASEKVGIPKDKVYLLDIPNAATHGDSNISGLKSLDQLIELGSAVPALEPLKLGPEEGAYRVAFLCYSSGTSGLPKGVKITHKNVIANTLQIMCTEKEYRERKGQEGSKPYMQTVMGLLPMSHIYGLVVICHASVYRGDQVVVLPSFDMKSFLQSIQRFKINVLFVVPPIIIAMINNKKILEQFDLGSIDTIFSGAAPLARETAEKLQEIWPRWLIRQGYGLTETSPVVSSTRPDDVWLGSSGSLLPGIEARLLASNGEEITEYDMPGELIVKSPSVVPGYLNNRKADQETFRNGFMYTGDEAVFRKAPSGNEHLFITDRIKELIKVKGLQVAPAELEACILSHPAVSDCAVIQVPDDAAGEAPKAFVVKVPGAIEESERLLVRSIKKHVEENKARHKWLKGGVEIIDAIPKSPSGKILRRILRDKESAKRRLGGARI